MCIPSNPPMAMESTFDKAIACLLISLFSSYMGNLFSDQFPSHQCTRIFETDHRFTDRLVVFDDAVFIPFHFTSHLKLRFKQKNNVFRSKFIDGFEDQFEGDKRHITRDDLVRDFSAENSNIGIFMNTDTRLTAQTRMKLIASDIHTRDTRAILFQKNLGKSTRRGTDIKGAKSA